MRQFVLAVMVMVLMGGIGGCKTIESMGKGMKDSAVLIDSLAHIVTTVGLYEVGEATEKVGQEVDKLPGL